MLSTHTSLYYVYCWLLCRIFMPTPLLLGTWILRFLFILHIHEVRFQCRSVQSKTLASHQAYSSTLNATQGNLTHLSCTERLSQYRCVMSVCYHVLSDLLCMYSVSVFSCRVPNNLVTACHSLRLFNLVNNIVTVCVCACACPCPCACECVCACVQPIEASLE